MLDQNTDRMWYVIGAIVIGAAIIAMGLNIFSESFDSVDGMMSDLSGVAFQKIDMIGSIDDIELGGNLLTTSNIKLSKGASSNIGSVDKFQLEVDDSAHGGIYLDRTQINYKPNTKYVLKYTYQKVSGNLVSFGGHFPFNPKTSSLVYVDGVLNSKDYHDPYSAFVIDDMLEHDVFIRFTTSDSLFENSPWSDKNVWIQPNRRNSEPVTVDITNLTLHEEIEGDDV